MLALLWSRPPWAHPDHGALGCGLARGGLRTPPPFGHFYSPWGQRRESWALRKVPGLATDPSGVCSQVLGRDWEVPESQKMLHVSPNLPKVLSTARSSAGQAAAASSPCRTEIPE